MIPPINPNDPYVYQREDYKYIADQIENHMLAVKYLIQELNQKLPLPESLEWRVEGVRPVWVYEDDK